MANTNNSFNDSQNKAIKMMNDAGQLANGIQRTINDGASAVQKVSEHMNTEMDAFLEKNRTKYDELRFKVLQNSLEKGEISAEEFQNQARSIHETAVSEKTQMMDKYTAAANAQGRKARNIGLGIGAAAAGSGALAFGASQLIKAIRNKPQN